MSGRTAEELAAEWEMRDCPHHGRADMCDYAGGIKDFADATERCACGRVAFLECDMSEGRGLAVMTPHSATERPSIHTTDRCADAVDWLEDGE